MIPDSKIHGANMGPIWGQHEPCYLGYHIQKIDNDISIMKYIIFHISNNKQNLTSPQKQITNKGKFYSTMTQCLMSQVLTHWPLGDSNLILCR